MPTDLAKAMQDQVPYFGHELAAFQGGKSRFAYMLAIVDVVARERRGASLRILEIGSWAGGSALTWAEGIHKHNRGDGSVVCVDAWKPYADISLYDDTNPARDVFIRMNAAAESGGIFDLFNHNIRHSPFGGIIEARRGTSREILPALSDLSFDLVYVDGSHVYSEAIFDLRAGIRVLADGGIICGDDLEIQLSELNPVDVVSVCETEYAKDQGRGEFYHPGVTLAVGQALGPVSCWEGFFAMQKRGTSFESISIPGSEKGHLPLPAHLK